MVENSDFASGSLPYFADIYDRRFPKIGSTPKASLNTGADLNLSEMEPDRLRCLQSSSEKPDKNCKSMSESAESK